MRLVPKKEVNAIAPAIPADVDVTAPAGSVAWAAVAPVSDDVASLQAQHAVAVDELGRLEARREQLAADIVAKQQQLEELAVRASGGDEYAQKHVRELYAGIEEEKRTLNTFELALKKTTDRVAELFRAHDQALAAQERAAAAEEVERVLGAAIASERNFFHSLATIQQSWERLNLDLEKLRSPSLAQACAASHAWQKLLEAHNSAFEALPLGVRSSWSRFFGGPTWADFVRTNPTGLLLKNAL